MAFKDALHTAYVDAVRTNMEAAGGSCSRAAMSGVLFAAQVCR